MLSKDDMDEYGYGKNPLDLSKSIAGGGNSCNITINFSKFAIETDTGDSIIKPPHMSILWVINQLMD